MDKTEKLMFTCPQCWSKLGTCQRCSLNQKCDFLESPNGPPKMIQQKIQQGNAFIITTIMNPARIEMFCKNKCPCYDEELNCFRLNYNTCKNYT